MMNIQPIPTLNTYQDWLKKAEKEFNDYSNSFNVYDFANCLLSLNALPEWISKTENISSELKEIVDNKLIIMRTYQIDIKNLKKFDIDNCLRLTRTFSNHTKHNDAKDSFIKISMSSKLPAQLPMKFEYLTIGNNEDNFIEAKELLNTIIKFWKIYI